MPKHTFLPEQLAESQQRLQNGDKAALLDVLFYYIVRGIQPPTWIKLKFYDAYAVVYDGHASSWDDVFGKPWPRRHLDDLRVQKSLAAPIINALRSYEKPTLSTRNYLRKRLIASALARAGQGDLLRVPGWPIEQQGPRTRDPEPEGKEARPLGGLPQFPIFQGKYSPPKIHHPPIVAAQIGARVVETHGVSKAVGWVEAEVDEWIDKCTARRDGTKEPEAA